MLSIIIINNIFSIINFVLENHFQKRDTLFNLLGHDIMIFISIAIISLNITYISSLNTEWLVWIFALIVLNKPVDFLLSTVLKSLIYTSPLYGTRDESDEFIISKNLDFINRYMSRVIMLYFFSISQFDAVSIVFAIVLIGKDHIIGIKPEIDRLVKFSTLMDLSISLIFYILLF